MRCDIALLVAGLAVGACGGPRVETVNAETPATGPAGAAGTGGTGAAGSTGAGGTMGGTSAEGAHENPGGAPAEVPRAGAPQAPGARSREPRADGGV